MNSIKAMLNFTFLHLRLQQPQQHFSEKKVGYLRGKKSYGVYHTNTQVV